MVANGFEGVPWFVGGGAKHSAEIARLAAVMGGSGMVEGIAAPGDLKVSATAGTADSNVHMAIGATSVLNRSANAKSQKYITRATQVSDIAIAATGGSGRSDLIVVSVEDPQYPPFSTSGWSQTQIENGPYVFPRIISGVPNTTKRVSDLGAGFAGGIYVSRSMIAIARIDIPAGTTNITSGMIKDLRKLQSPHTDQVMAIVSGQTWGEVLGTGATSWTNFPNVSISIDVPTWATRAFITLTLNTVATDGVASDANARVSIGGLTAQSAAWDYNGAPPGAGGHKLPFPIVGDLDVTSLQGQTVTVRPQMIRTFTSNAGLIQFDPNSACVFDVRFMEQVV